MKFSCTFAGESLVEVAQRAQEYADAVLHQKPNDSQMELPLAPAPAKGARGRPRKDATAEVTAPPQPPVIEAPPAPPSMDDLLGAQDAPVVTKEKIVEGLQKLSAYVGAKGGGAPDVQQATGVNAVRQVFTHFGASRLGEIEEKRYPELLKFIEERLRQ